MNKEENLFKKPISELSLMIFNDSDKENKRALNELRRRGKSAEHVIRNHDESVIAKRGHDINSYLIRKDPSLQQLFEIYFSYVAKNENNNKYLSELLFSEKFFYDNNFFYTIYSNELFNIELRIEENNSVEKKEELMKYRESLNDHKEAILKRIRDSKTKVAFYKKSENYSLISEDKMAQKFFDNLFFNDYQIDFNPLFNPIEKIYEEIFPCSIIIGDSIRLSKHRSILLDQSKKGIELDYTTEPMQKILKINE